MEREERYEFKQLKKPGNKKKRKKERNGVVARGGVKKMKEHILKSGSELSMF